MANWVDRLDEIIEQQKKEDTPITVESIPGITLADFARRDIAVEIYSALLGRKLWLCSNNEMAAQIRKDSPQQVCYTVEELRHLIGRNLDPKRLKTVHDAKATFLRSTIKEALTKEDSDIPEEVLDETPQNQGGTL